MIHVIATVRIKKGKRDKFLEYLRANIKNVIKEKLNRKETKFENN